MKNTTTNRILMVLSQGPAIAHEVGAALGISSGLASSHLSSLHSYGRLKRTRFTKTTGGSGVKRVWMYSPRGRRGIPT